MGQRFYDTATGAIRDFTPIVDGEVSIYYCGATVQGKPHVGHIRSAVVFDILTRWLEYAGYRVTLVRNVTDIDDKILTRSAESFDPEFTPTDDYPASEPWWALAYRFENAFAAAYAALGVRRPTYEPRATGHIPEMIQLIQRLIDAGHAYQALDGSADVYFDVKSWPAYGALTHQSADNMQDAEDAPTRGKKDPRDFTLWKSTQESDPAGASWQAPWGAGRPGWHIECSAMATKYLGRHFDIHGGGLDLRFPHHENELAQSSAAGDRFANFWMHNGLVTAQGEKMSKSVGNTVSPEEMLSMARAGAVRYFLGQAHYRSQLDYHPAALEEAQSALERIEMFQARAAALSSTPVGLDTVPEQFSRAMEDDLNVPEALAVLHATVRAGNSALDAGDSEAVMTYLSQVNTMVEVLGLNSAAEGDDTGSAAHRALEALVDAQIAARAQARQRRDWATADAIRDQLAAAGVVVEDAADGVTWSITEPKA
ncbi:cysteine--tRNA ligase [Enteractinococcus coprophilus]|uniref:Cysteine--tRNA ligase n=1 Tax=Enteractinococcus coprophilus TaxID=1027633 RepID=A0A543AFS6_9MICC|nr:cysteine--tRNA ligase [Enteractinococcus coprophilus]TQL71420.1 cysteinyl-tRNA synthetase [Enteractinococcus coprophilus]